MLLTLIPYKSRIAAAFVFLALLYCAFLRFAIGVFFAARIFIINFTSFMPDEDLLKKQTAPSLPQGKGEAAA